MRGLSSYVFLGFVMHASEVFGVSSLFRCMVGTRG
jgi:hypothetical protein